ncbi:non-ribosomal peptide synthetase/type I polyketide synthase [Vibrio tarriae]|uniref:non-ribosomal peptide synthetase/type I polyketide synthase n=1 Tax=Vibrio tarriae TaxID=2014742 RepID=UPI000DE33D70|nr:non-ribosomal peptide synthetase/type I polyketide synthase [Vibrio tarriae]RBM55274.1 hypothetical protein DLR64_02345 [Vibrio tarriae]
MTVPNEFDIAIIGCAGRFPGAKDADEFWQNLLSNKHGIRELRKEERCLCDEPEQRVWLGGILDDADNFDADFFSFSQRDAQLMDPQLRLAFENVWLSLDDAGYAPESCAAKTGLYLGAGINFPWQESARKCVPDNLASEYELNTYVYRDFFATRIAYQLGLQGPAITVNTACSTSLVSVHLACQALLAGECDLAVAGGVHLLHARTGYLYQQGMILSPDGYCRPFDQQAGGTVWGEGAAFVTLKRATEAVADGDHIISVIKASAINNDGVNKIGYTAPSVQGQSAVISQALDLAGIGPQDINFVETHGTATRLGDPLEVKSIMSLQGKRREPLFLGAAKASVGHLDVAAGVTGLIKAAKSLQHRVLPGHPMFSGFSSSICQHDPNSVLKINTTPICLPQEGPVYAGVSSFGIGGTNAHVILASPPTRKAVTAQQEGETNNIQVFIRSAKSEQSAQAMLREFKSQDMDDSSANRAFTLSQRTHVFPYRFCTVRDSVSGQTLFESLATCTTDIAPIFVFPGQGSHYRGMAFSLYQSQPQFKVHLDECFTILENIGFQAAKRRLFEYQDHLSATKEVQPLLFSVQYAMAKTLLNFGLRPRAMVGHSLGEIVAATLADVFTLPQALAFVVERGVCMSEAPLGVMYAVEDLPDDFVLPVDAYVALHNSPRHQVISAALNAEAALKEQLIAWGGQYKKLTNQHPFHTPMMKPCAERLQQRFEQLGLSCRCATLPLGKNLTGEVSQEAYYSAEYWAAHITQPIMFSQNIAAVLEQYPKALFVEVGPAGGMLNAIRQHQACQDTLDDQPQRKHEVDYRFVSTLGKQSERSVDQARFINALASAWVNGANIDWTRLYPSEQHKKVPVSSYRFASQPFTQVRKLINVGKVRESLPISEFQLNESNYVSDKINNSSTQSLTSRERVCQIVDRLWLKQFGNGIGDPCITSFFSAGGDSLSAVSFVASLKQDLRIDVPISWVLNGEPIEHLISKLTEQVIGQDVKDEASTSRHPMCSNPLVQDRVDGMADEKISASVAQAEYPLTLAQQRLWLLDRVSSSVDYHIVEALRFDKPLSIDALQTALTAIVNRHDSLRTTYHELGEDLVQRVQPAIERLPLATELTREEFLAELIDTAQLQFFDLTCDVMLRAHLYQLECGQCVLLLVLNHIAADGGSMGVIASELDLFYRHALGEPVTLPKPLLHTYGQYALELQDKVEAQQKALKYWCDKLRGLPESTELQWINDRGEMENRLNKQTGHQRLMFNATSMQKIERFCQSENTTPFGLISTTLGILLGKLSGMQDVTIGTTVADRLDPRWQSLVGFFTNTLVMRHRWSDEQTIREVILQNHMSFIEDWQNLHLDFNQLMEQLSIARTESVHPLFQTMLVSLERSPLKLGEQFSCNEPIPSLPMSLDLYLTTWREDGQLCLDWKYRQALFPDALVEHMLNQFQHLIEQIIDYPERSMAQLQLLSVSVNPLANQHEEALTLPMGKETVLDLFAQQVIDRPEALALRDEQGDLNYQTLDRYANQLAYVLEQQGVQTGQPVAIALPRGRWWAISILAIFKLGAHYVPLDVSYPQSRIDYILKDVDAKLVLDSPQTKNSWPCASFTLEEVHLFQAPQTRFVSRATSKNLAYVIYTSGSTGKPKGVGISHDNLIHYCCAAQHHYHIQPTDKVAQTTSIGFDASVEEHMMALCYGASLVYRNEVMISSLSAFSDFVAHHGISVVSLPTGLWHVLVDGLDREIGQYLAQHLRLCILGGEALQPARLAQWQSTMPEKVQVLNTYGPTEATVIATVMDVTRECGQCQLPIGRPLPGVSVTVVGKDGQPVPRGVIGELWISGRTVASGYLNQPDKTAESFIEHIGPDGKNTRSYRTGDRVKWRKDGQLIYIGRADNQIKYRGFRIELGEIESALHQLDNVQDAVVAVCNEVLCAWVVATENAFSASNSVYNDANSFLQECQEALSQHLPAHMIPTHWANLASLPLNVNGKTDKRSLPEAKALTTPHGEKSSVISQPSMGNIEAQLAQMWQQLLNCGEVQLEDNFFALGGHSLKLTRLFSIIERRFNVSLDYAAFFRNPVLLELSQQLRKLSVDHQRLSTVPATLPFETETGSNALSINQSRLWYLAKSQASEDSWLMHFAWDMHGKLDIDALQKTLDFLVIKHESLRTSLVEFELHNPVLHVNPPQSVSLKHIKLSSGSEEEQYAEREQVLQEATQRHMPLHNKVLVEGTLIEQTPQVFTLLLTFHHVASDGWSMGIIFDDFNAFYNALTLGQSLPSLSSAYQYRDFAHWQNLEHSSEGIKDSVAFWKDYLVQLPEVHKLPLDHPRPSVLSGKGAIHHHVISKAMVEQIEAMSTQFGATPFMVLHTSLSVLFGLLSDQKDVVISTAVANRTRAEFESIVGLFVHTMLLRCQWLDEQTFSQVLEKQVQDIAQCFHHQNVAVELLLEELHHHRTRSYTSMTQLMLIFHNNEAGYFSHPELQVSQHDLTRFRESALFEIRLSILPSQHGEYDCHWEYSTDLFSVETIERMANQFVRVLESVTQDPETAISQLVLDSPSDMLKRLQWQTGQPMSLPGVVNHVLDLFFEQVMRKPLGTAVQDKLGSLTYRDLDVLSNQLAQILVENGVQNGAPVVMSLPRGRWWSVAMLAIFKVGAHYVPIEAAYPQSRVDFILEDVGASLVLDHATTLRPWPCRCLTLSDNLLSGVIQEPVSRDLNASSPAYIIYTSGSTGKPKGVVVDHSNLAHYCFAAQQHYQITPSDVLAQITSIGFDASVEEHMMALCYGATLVYRDEEMLASLDAFSDFVGHHNISVVSLPTALWHVLCDELDESNSRKLAHQLRLCILGGEAIQAQRLEHWLRLVDDQVQLLNTYGPTETTVIATVMDVTKRDCFTESVPIGRPIAGLTAHIMGANGQPAPLGSEGELWLSGPSVTQGYLNQPEKTHQAFVVLPTQTSAFKQPVRYHQDNPCRCYRTGDRVRWNSQGQLLYLGRTDDQVKYRGYRIELGEIKTILEQLPEIEEAIVLVNNDHLCAWVKNAMTQDDVLTRSHQWAVMRLPEHMVPTQWAQLAQFPLTINGKLDKKALPRTAPIAIHSQNKREMSRAEKRIAKIWQEVLQNGEVYADDNYFELGGQSLKLIRLLSLLQKEFASQISLHEFLDEPTVAGVARLIERQHETRNSYNYDVELESDTRIEHANQLVIGGDLPDGVTPFMIREVALSDTDVSRAHHAVVLLPGIGGLGHSLYSVGRQLKAEYVIGFHLFDVNAAGLIQLADQVVDQLQLLPNVLCPSFVGHSLGGCLAYLCHQRWFERTGMQGQLVVVDSFPLVGGQQSWMKLGYGFLSLIGQQVEFTRLPRDSELNSSESVMDFIADNSHLHSDDLTQLNKIWTVYQRQASYSFVPKAASVERLSHISARESAHGQSVWHSATTLDYRHFEVNGDHYSMLIGENAAQTAAAINQALGLNAINPVVPMNKEVKI